MADYSKEEVEQINEGLALLGFAADERVTNEDMALLRKVADEAIVSKAKELGFDDVRDRLAQKAYEILFALFGLEERVTMIHGVYLESARMKPLVPLIDEATLAFYRGYFTASLATMFIILERYLRSLMNWQPADPDPKFSDLEAAIARFPESNWKDTASRIVSAVYARYKALSPPPFQFNRHGLLHGVRGPLAFDEMNCGRMFYLFDCLVTAENTKRRRGYVVDAAFNDRIEAYRGCSRLAREKKLLE